MDPKETIKKNLKRRSEFVDIVPIHKGVPMPTWVELSLIDVCNRKCSFCPKVDEKIAPDTFQKMTRKIKEKVGIKVKTTGNIVDINHAEKIIKSGKADLVSFGRKFINSPTWLIKELLHNKKKMNLPNQYKRCFK